MIISPAKLLVLIFNLNLLFSLCFTTSIVKKLLDNKEL
nr:MAG TPA: hypothetical protein [Caudoviricetes sp.]